MIKINKNLVFTVLFLSTAYFAKAQQDAQYSQYMFNSLVINPAYAGYKEVLNISALTRVQWVGIDGGPQTQSIILDGSFFNDRVGLGLSVVNDKIGLQRQSSAYINYAYRLPVGEDDRLSFGLGVGVGQYAFDGSDANTDDPNDPNFNYGKTTSFIAPDARVGVHYSSELFYVGLSTTNLFSDILNNQSGTQNQIAKQGRHFFLTAGYLYPVNDFLKFKPSFLIKEDTKGPSNLDINNFFLLGDKVWLGVSYRTSVNLLKKRGVASNIKSQNALVGIVELYAGKMWRLGYAYDHTLSSLKGYAGPTHEVSLSLTLGPKRDLSVLSPRYF